MKERNLDFDRITDRRNTKSLKYDFAKRMGYSADALPLWVADMDFRTSSYVEDALEKVVRHNIYGYSNIQPGDGFFEAVSGWMKRHHDWDVDMKWHVITPGVCFAIATAVRAYTSENDAILIQQPVYYPFENIIRQNNRRCVSSDIAPDNNGKWMMDFDDFEEKIIDYKIRLFILCNPHNPVGRVWRRDELEAVGRICKKHNVTVFSDEIHSDFVWEGVHNVFQEIDPDFKSFTVTATSPSKTFNLAGLQLSNIFIPDEKLRRLFKREFDAVSYEEPNIFGIEAAAAAYKYGDEWHAAMTAYVNDNLETACDYVNAHIPGAGMRKPEGTYLLWMDLNGLGISDDRIEEILKNEAKVWLDGGRMFGCGGKGYQRINAACPRKVLMEALERMGTAMSKVTK